MRCSRCGREMEPGSLYCVCGAVYQEPPTYAQRPGAQVNVNAMQNAYNNPNYSSLPGGYIAFIVISGVLLSIFSLMHLALSDMRWDDIVIMTQWVRYTVVIFSFVVLARIILDPITAIRYKLFVALVIVALFVITWFFLFPEVPDDKLWNYIRD